MLRLIFITTPGSSVALSSNRFFRNCVKPPSGLAAHGLLSFVLFKNYFDKSVVSRILFERALCCARNSPGVRHLRVKSHVDGDRLGVTLDAHFLHTALCF